MSDPDWDLSVSWRIRWYKVLRPHPSTCAIGMMGPHQPGGPRAPKHVKTALTACRGRSSLTLTCNAPGTGLTYT